MVHVWHWNAGWWEEYFIIGWHTRFLSSSSHFSKWFASVPEEIKFFGSRISTQIKIFKSLVNLFPFYSCSATTLGQKKKTNAYKPKLSGFFDGIAIPLFETLSYVKSDMWKFSDVEKSYPPSSFKKSVLFYENFSYRQIN